jgi:cation:H+ antiporter
MAAPLKKIWIHFLLSAAVVVGCGIWLAYIGDGFVDKMGWHSSFVGTLILGFATTMPEIAVSFSALRIGAHEMAVANMIGSNLFNYAIIFVNDALYLRGDIFAALDSAAHLNTAALILVMTVVVIVGMRLRVKRKLAAGLAWYSYLLAALFLAGAVLNFSSK